MIIYLSEENFPHFSSISRSLNNRSIVERNVDDEIKSDIIKLLDEDK